MHRWSVYVCPSSALETQGQLTTVHLPVKTHTYPNVLTTKSAGLWVDFRHVIHMSWTHSPVLVVRTILRVNIYTISSWLGGGLGRLSRGSRCIGGWVDPGIGGWVDPPWEKWYEVFQVMRTGDGVSEIKHSRANGRFWPPPILRT